MRMKRLKSEREREVGVRNEGKRRGRLKRGRGVRTRNEKRKKIEGNERKRNRD